MGRNRITAGGGGITGIPITDAAFASLVAASGLTLGTIYRVGTPEVWYRATGTNTYLAIGSDLADATPGTGTVYAPSLVKSIGFSTAVAAAMEALSDALPKNVQWTTPTVPEQGVIELGHGKWTLEKTFSIDLAGAGVSRYGLTIRGQGRASTQLVVPSTASPAAFKGVDGIWRAMLVRGDTGGKISHFRLERFGVLSYATQDGDGVTSLIDPCRWIDLKSVFLLRLEGLLSYMRKPTAMSLDQYMYALSSCYYSSLDDVFASVFPSTENGVAMNGAVKPRRGGVGFLFNNNNAITVDTPCVLGANLAFHLVDEDGAFISGGYSEGVNKTILFDGDSSFNRLHGHRCEFNHGAYSIAMEALSEIYFARFAENTDNNYAEQYAWAGYGSLRQDFSASQSNRVHALIRDSKQTPPTNLIASWVNGSGITTSSNADVPSGIDPSITSSVEITSTGGYNQNRVSNAIAVNPDLGSVWYRVICKRISGYGMFAPELVSNAAGSSIVYGSQPIQTPLLWTMTTIPVSAVSWAGGKLTITCPVPHGFQAGMRTRNAVAWGTLAINSEMYVESATEFSAVLIAAAAGTISDPGAVTVPTTLSVISGMNHWLGRPDITAEWQEFAANIPIRVNVTAAPTLDGSNQAVINVGTLLGLTTGSKIKLSGFADSRINGAYTVLSGDLSGSNLTLTGRGAMVGLNAAATGHGATTAGYYGQVGLTELKAQWRVVTTNTGQNIVWRVAGEQIMQGPR